MGFMDKVISISLMSLWIVNQVAFATDLALMDHLGPVYCTSDALCTEYCNTIRMHSTGTTFPCCTKVLDETGTRFPICYCCANLSACETLEQNDSGCGDCTQVISQYKTAYIDKQCKKRGSKREDATKGNIWTDPNAKVQPQPRHF